MGQLALTGAVVLTPFVMIEDAVILINGKRIKALGSRDRVEIPADYREISLDGYLIAPGLIDQHVHGCGGAEVMSGKADALRDMARFQAVHGVTSFLATTMSGSRDQLVAVARAYHELQEDNYKGARCLGLHLEGPYLSNRFSGIHSPYHLRSATLEEVTTLNRISGNGIKMVTMAPEVPGVLELAKELSNAGIICSIGHSDADYATAQKAVDEGFSCVTHCFNGVRPFHHREPGVVGVALTDDRLRIELIADEHHLHPNTVMLAWKMKGFERIILVSDAMAPAGLVDGNYNTAMGELSLVDGRLTDSMGRLSGSAITLEQAVKNFWDYTGCELTDAFRAATYNPARLLGINKRKGSLYPGKDADLIVLTPQLDVVMTMVEGEIISGIIAVD
ncbi:MAG TPA: N-acetylglucosamine-6-phosphate deacetylase [Bacillota bacterium]|nr:N-acetylglucosamine-6-phosphate deacetylase [Bacillota bacterium]HPT88589.1 N-acetylglucosamine-6-phosphate deacetylase [Bacillota bacterium]